MKRAVLYRVLVGIALVISVAGPASALPSATAAPALTGCDPSQISAWIPAQIPGDPGPGSEQVSWNVVLRDTSAKSCSLRGWPSATVLNAAGHPLRTSIAKVQSGEFQFVPSHRLTLRPGRSAVVTVVGSLRMSRCPTAKSLLLALPVGGRTIQVRPLARKAAMCGTQLSISPFYSMAKLRAAIRGLSLPGPGRQPFPVTTARRPADCSAANLLAKLDSTATQRDHSAIIISLTSRSVPCSLSSAGWPAVRLHLSDGSSPVAKAFPYGPAMRRSVSPLLTYGTGANARTVVPLRPGASTSIVVLSATPIVGQQKCLTARSATIYPTGLARGQGRKLPFNTHVKICGELRVLPYLSDRPQVHALALAQSAIAATLETPVQPANDKPPGFWYGSHGPRKMYCGNGSTAYKMDADPANDCSSTDGNYGGYLGEIGRWSDDQGCITSGLALNKGGTNAADTNYDTFGKGVGAALYWMMAGPGRRGSRTNKGWGKYQADAVIADADAYAHALDYPYVFMDIEQYGGANSSGQMIDNGWHKDFTNKCDVSSNGNNVTTSQSDDVWNGFWNEIINMSPWEPGTYSSGGSGTYEWQSIFGSMKTTDTEEWTYNYETHNATAFPDGWTTADGHGTKFFAGDTKYSSCAVVWAWSGNAGVDNGYTHWWPDQIDGARASGCK